MAINDYPYQWVQPTYTYGSTTRKVITVREYDEEGRLVKETVTEETHTPNTWTTPTYPSYPTITYGQSWENNFGSDNGTVDPS